LSNISDLIRDSIKQITPYSPGKSSREVKEELGLAEVVKLASNENPLGPCPQAIEAMQQAAAEVYFYPDPLCRDLTDALAEKWDVDPAGILVGRGSDEIIHMMGLAFINPGEEIIYSDPWFALYPITAALMDARAVTIPHRDFVHDLPAMAEAITERTKLVLISNPYNPTGTIVTAQQVAEFMDAIPDHVIVGFDEAYYEYVDDPDYPDCLDYVREGRNVVVLRTFSKAYGLASRCASRLTSAAFRKWRRWPAWKTLTRSSAVFNWSRMASNTCMSSLTKWGWNMSPRRPTSSLWMWRLIHGSALMS